MKKFLPLFLFVSFIFLQASAQEAKIISECTVYFNVAVEDSKADPKVVKAMAGSNRILYIKGSKRRSDFETPNFKQIVVYDSKSDSVIILRELGNIKYISFLTQNLIKEKNKKYEGIKFTKTDEKKTILGYECIKVIANLTNGSAYDVYYAPAIIPANTEYEFKDIPGFVLEYEEQSESGKTKIKYSASKITLVPVPEAKFDIPKSGYRVL